jgi:hypothetical protein
MAWSRGIDDARTLGVGHARPQRFYRKHRQHRACGRCGGGLPAPPPWLPGSRQYSQTFRIFRSSIERGDDGGICLSAVPARHRAHEPDAAGPPPNARPASNRWPYRESACRPAKMRRANLPTPRRRLLSGPHQGSVHFVPTPGFLAHRVFANTN